MKYLEVEKGIWECKSEDGQFMYYVTNDWMTFYTLQSAKDHVPKNVKSGFGDAMQKIARSKDQSLDDLA